LFHLFFIQKLRENIASSNEILPEMNILIVNLTCDPSGGDWTYVENLTRICRQKGHRIISFPMKDSRNPLSTCSGYDIENIDYKNERLKIAFLMSMFFNPILKLKQNPW